MEEIAVNTKNNRLTRATDEQIIRVVYDMLAVQKRPISKITIREICEGANIHRSTFYAHYQDVYDVVEKVERKMSEDLTASFLEEMDQRSSAKQCFTRLFEFIREYREFYAFYLLDAHRFNALQVAWDMVRERYTEVDFRTMSVESQEEMNYHGACFLFGMTAVLRYWLEHDCRESPAELYEIMKCHGHVFSHMISW